MVIFHCLSFLSFPTTRIGASRTTTYRNNNTKISERFHLKLLRPKKARSGYKSFMQMTSNNEAKYRKGAPRNPVAAEALDTSHF